MARTARPTRVAVLLDRASAMTAGVFAGVLEDAKARRWTLTADPADADGVLTDGPRIDGRPTVRVGPMASDADVRPSADAAAAIAASFFADIGFRPVAAADTSDDPVVDQLFDASDGRVFVARASRPCLLIQKHGQDARATGPERPSRSTVAPMPQPAAVFMESDAAAARFVVAARAAGRSVPGDVAVLSIGNDVLTCELAAVPLSSIDPDAPRVGRTAVARLGRLLRGRPVEPWQAVPPRGVVRRASTDTLAVADADVAAAVRFIRENAVGPLRVGDVMRAVGLDRRTLERRFAKALDRSPAEVLRRWRIDVAAEMLRTTDRPVGEVAKACGFRLPQHLAAAFRQIHGQTPSDYRRLLVPSPVVFNGRGLGEGERQFIVCPQTPSP